MPPPQVSSSFRLPATGLHALRLRSLNERPPRPSGEYVLYWMTSARRATWNFGLQRAAELATEYGKPLLILEALRCGHPWASPRFHRFILQGMADNARVFKERGVRYHPYLEARPGVGKGLLASLSGRAVAVVTDEFPCFTLPRMIEAAVHQVDVRFEQVDSNGLFPLRGTDRVFPSAHTFRRMLQKELPPHLSLFPGEDSLDGLAGGPMATVPDEVLSRWPSPPGPDLALVGLSSLPLDRSVPTVETRGGAVAAGEALDAFVNRRLSRYTEARNEPTGEASSGLSPYLHFGHLSAHEVFHRIAECEGWTVAALSPKITGSKVGFWGMSPSAEAFLDELITWREVGYNFCSKRPDYHEYSSLPTWARDTLYAHRNDPREPHYSLETLEGSATHDPLWNAAQTQLVREGRIHNYLRMLWGKKILQWSASPEEALTVLIHLNNKYALDGRNPNSYSGIFWILGRYDRPWGPERPIFGFIRYMSSENTARKFSVKEYVRRYSGREQEEHKR